ncbi:MAG: shikimate kinase [Flavobacteriales bacterium]|nr:shikimate kinase [Flavobacteriales bacterium]
MHVQLIGFMCAGKSRVGRDLGLLLGMPFIDLDRVIEQRVGPIKPFFEREGEEAFRTVEAEVLQDLLAGPASVIATGGGTPMEGDNLGRMIEAGKVVWLDVPVDVLIPRIERAGGDRPLLAGLKGDALRDRVRSMLEQRTPIYQKAQHRIEATGPPHGIAERIAQVLQLK